MSRQRSMEKIQESEYVSIGELAKITGCRYSTLKFYTEEGMIPFEQREENLTRRFPRVLAMKRIAQILEMKQEGRKIPEMKAVLERDGGNHMQAVMNKEGARDEMEALKLLAKGRPKTEVSRHTGFTVAELEMLLE